LFGGITTNPTGAWSTQAARNRSMCHRDLFVGAGALVRDRGRGSQFGDAFEEVFRSHNIQILKCPVRTPVANAYAERWIGTLRRELLDRTIIWNQCQLERLVVDYLDHYNTHRPPPPPPTAIPERTRTCHPAAPARRRPVDPLWAGSSTSTETPHDQPRHHFRHPHAEIRSLGNTLASWRSEILARHSTGASNGPTEGLNLCVKKVKRCGHGFRRFDNYRLRVLLHTGGVTWPQRPHHHASEHAAPHSDEKSRQWCRAGSGWFAVVRWSWMLSVTCGAGSSRRF
jgi:hypothetical protein